jgi:hypothetical protein
MISLKFKVLRLVISVLCDDETQEGKSLKSLRHFLAEIGNRYLRMTVMTAPLVFIQCRGEFVVFQFAIQKLKD